METTWLIPAVLATAPAGAVLILCCARNTRLCEYSVLIAPPLLFALVCALYPAVLSGARPEWILGGFLAGIPLAFRVEPLGLLFALTSSLLWIPTALYSIGYARGHDLSRRPRFYACFALALGCSMGIAFSANLLTLFVCYELLTLCTYPLVTHEGGDKARRAGRYYLGYLLGTSMGMQLLAILWVWSLTGSVQFQPGGILPAGVADAVVAGIFLLFVFGTGKVALMPLHRWLPQAMVAPTPVSALLHAVAVVKAGGFVILKISVYIVGVDRLMGNLGAEIVLYAAALTVVAASLIALGRDNLKERLAYSTIAQLAYIVLGAALASATGILGGGMHVITHAFGKITLFFCAGAIALASHRTRVSELNGLGRQFPLVMAAFLIGSFSIIGLPPTGGLWSKWLLLLGAVQAHHYVPLAALILSSLLSVYYLLSIPIRAFFIPAADSRAETGRVPWLCQVGICITAAGCLLLFFFPAPIRILLQSLFS